MLGCDWTGGEAPAHRLHGNSRRVLCRAEAGHGRTGSKRATSDPAREPQVKEVELRRRVSERARLRMGMGMLRSREDKNEGGEVVGEDLTWAAAEEVSGCSLQE